MENILAFVIKLTVIFFGSGLVTLLAYYIGKEASTIPRLVLDYEQKKKEKEIVNLQKKEKISSKSGIYEVLFPSGKLAKLFSSHEGMKLLS